MKQTKQKFPVMQGAGRRLTFNARGDIVSALDNGATGDCQVRAKELDQLVAASNFRAQYKPVEAPATVGDAAHEIDMNEDGSLFIGCQQVSRKTLLKFHAASLAIRRRKRNQSQIKKTVWQKPT